VSEQPLRGQRALVTGASSGIGEGIARALGAAGAAVVVNYAGNAAGATRVVADLQAAGADALAIRADVAREADVEAMFAQVLGAWGRLDILINNAGTNIRKPIHEYTLGEWHRVLDTNLTSAFLCSHAAYPLFKQVGAGKVINIGSMMSIFGASFAPAYAASKGGIVQLTKSMASAWAADNIQVNAVLPGWIETDLTAGAKREVPGLNENVLRRTPAKRWGVIDDMAGVAVFLSSAASDFVTGTAIPVDGGYSIQG
jgi:2-deoxy-D-gluconate 3-dehydrogenase